jgi:ABC-2 type transport system permease protein
MIPTLKSEFKKILTIRSTYLWILIALVIVGIYSFYGEGFKDSATLLRDSQAHPLKAQLPLFIAGTITQLATFIGLFGGIIALLHITHEYRYNTITYTLTASNSRTKVLAAKFLSIFGFIFAYAVLMGLIGIGLIFAGLSFSHNVLPHQDVNYLTYLGKLVFNAEAYALAGLLFGVLIRNMAGSFAALFIIPGPVEALLSLMLRTNSVYLPFTALSQVIQAPTIMNGHPAHPDRSTGYLSAPKGALVFLAYLVVGWAVAWYLFLRRDAS